MCIAHIIATFPPKVGGMGKVAYDECMELVRNGHEVTVFTLDYSENPTPSPSPYKGGTEGGIEVVRLKPILKSGDAGWVPQLYTQLRGFDVVHLHYPWYGGAEWVWLARILRKQKYVVTYHMDAAPTKLYQQLVQRVYDVFLSATILNSAEKVFVVDREHFAHSRFGALVKSDKIVELPNPINTSLFSPEGTEVSLDPEKFNLLFVGNLLQVKRLDLLLGALAELPDDVVLTVVGSGYNEEEYRIKNNELRIKNRVNFVGAQLPEKVAEYYRVADCTVIPSDAESFSLVAVESLACGTPVIASDIPGMRGRVEEGMDGFLFEAGLVKSLVIAIQKMLDLSPDERRGMGERGIQKVMEKYGLEKHAKKLVSVYNEIKKLGN